MLTNRALSLFSAALITVLSAGLNANPATADEPRLNEIPLAAQNLGWGGSNDVNGVYSSKDKFAFVDVNDKFLVKSVSEDGFETLRVAILDGMREKYGPCSSGINPKPGDARTTWLHISYSKQKIDGSRDVIVRRTLNFFDKERVYRFSTKGTQYAVLDPEVRIEFANNIITYTQIGGPLGTSGATKAIRVKHKITDSYKQLMTTVEMDRKLWAISANTVAADPIFEVNGKNVHPFASDSGNAPDTVGIVVDPMLGPGISQLPISELTMVSDTSAKGEELSDVETEDQNAAALCFVRQCLTFIECLYGTSNPPGQCPCAPISGPAVGVCVL
jgi:hypothetical protein